MSLADTTNWAVHELADADLGDLRRTKRLGDLAPLLAHNPRASLPAACGPSARLKGAYRFFENDDIAPHDIVQSHLEATYGRVAHVPLVLAVQATPAVHWTTRRTAQGLGPLGNTACQGLFVQSPVAITPDRVPVGLVAQQVWARAPHEIGQRARRKPWPITQQESQQGLHRLEAVCTARAWGPTTRWGSVGDRAADGSDVLAAARPEGGELGLRAAWERCVSAPQHTGWATVEAQPVCRQIVVHVPRRDTQPAREAPVARRYGPLTVCPPRHRKAEGVPAVSLWAVLVCEAEAPAEGEPIEGLRLTTVAVDSVEEAMERVHWDSCRGGIEVGHRIVKSGCRIAARPWETAERLRRCLALYRVLAWRILYATMLARAVPEAPWSVLLALEEWQALSWAIQRVSTPPPAPPTLGQAVTWIAQRGGFVGRRRRDRPGTDVLWRGFQHLGDLTTMYGILRPAPP